MRASGLVLILLLSACSSAGSLPYTMTTAGSRPTIGPRIGQITASDQRGEPPRWVGAVRGGFGNPLKVINTTDTVQDEVVHAFETALRMRGYLAGPGNGKYNLAVVIRKLDCSQYVRREAHADLQVTVIDRNGRRLYTDNVQANVASGSKVAIDTGVFGSSDDLRDVASEVLSKAIDQAIDKPAFAAAIGGRPQAMLRADDSNG
jgi:hypothetical protein